jgi:glucosylglycerol-phosphate synthase
MQAPAFTLATDLDGTLLAGSAADRGQLAVVLSGARTIFVTGRALETVRPLLLDPLVPKPAFIIADVGATVVDGESLRPIQPIQSRIDAAWPGAHRVLDVLSQFSDLVRQQVPQERRCSYHIDDESVVTEEVEEAVRRLGCDLLISSGRYLDILPRGVSKGSTLSLLLEHLGIDRDGVIVAGDSLNDLSMFLTGIAGVVVRNGERALVERLKDVATVHFARSEGAAGIMEALAARGLAEQTPIPRSRAFSRSSTRQLIMVYHRLPSDRAKSPNGIIPSLLGFFRDGRPGAWIGWSIVETTDGFEERVPVAPEYPGLVASRIALKKSDVEKFYQQFSKEALWPVIFSFPSRVDFSHEGWEHFLHINRLFAARTAREAEPEALVWIHDYNLWMVPQFLRALRPDLRIAFFHHTAFPSPDVFNMLPWRQQILGSLLSCDYVGFHIPRYVENFVEVVASNAPALVRSRIEAAPRFVTYGCALGVGSMATEIEVGDRRLRLGAHPVGVDVEQISSLVGDPQVAARTAEIRRQIGERTAILSIERLDYVKGPLQKVQAFEQLLERRPELRGKVVLINIVTPPSSGMKVYDQLGEHLDLAVGGVNGRFGTIDWTPVNYLVRSFPFDEVVSYYAASDVAWITPLRDGLNLVAKEYVAAKVASGTEGVLILSEFAGAAVELHGALLTNPYDSTSMLDVLSHSLTIDADERRERLRRLAQIVEHNHVRRWGEEFLAAALGGRS